MADFTRVADVAELPDPGKTLVEVDGEMVAVFHVGGSWYAIDDVCTHDGGPLADGELLDHTIACPRHGAKFDIRTGAALTMPAVRPTRSHEVRVQDGGIWIRLRNSAQTDGPTAAGLPGAAVGGPRPADGSPASPGGPSSVAADGPGSATATGDAAAAPVAARPLCEETVRELLKEVKDPELFVNIVDLGLVYGVTVSPAADAAGKQHVAIDMTMTSPACPAGPQLIGDTKRVVGGRPEVSAVEVRIVMDPPWTPDRMTEAARDQLGIF